MGGTIAHFVATATMQTLPVLHRITSQLAGLISNDSTVVQRNDLCICSTAQETSSILVSTVAGKRSYRHNAQSGPASQGLAASGGRSDGSGIASQCGADYQR